MRLVSLALGDKGISLLGNFKSEGFGDLGIHGLWDCGILGYGDWGMGDKGFGLFSFWVICLFGN